MLHLLCAQSSNSRKAFEISIFPKLGEERIRHAIWHMHCLHCQLSANQTHGTWRPGNVWTLLSCRCTKESCCSERGGRLQYDSMTSDGSDSPTKCLKCIKMRSKIHVFVSVSISILTFGQFHLSRAMRLALGTIKMAAGHLRCFLELPWCNDPVGGLDNFLNVNSRTKFPSW